LLALFAFAGFTAQANVKKASKPGTARQLMRQEDLVTCQPHPTSSPRSRTTSPPATTTPGPWP